MFVDFYLPDNFLNSFIEFLNDLNRYWVCIQFVEEYRKDWLINWIHMSTVRYSVSASDLRALHCYCSVVHLPPTLCDPMNCGLPESSVHGVLQARILEWVTMLSSRKSSRLRDRTPKSLMSPALAGGSLPLALPGKPSQRTQWFLFPDKQSQTMFAHLKL